MNQKYIQANDKKEYLRKYYLLVSLPFWCQYLLQDFNNKPSEEIREDVESDNTWDDAAEERKKYDQWVLEIARVYRRLSLLPRLNEKQAKLMLKILELSEFDDALNYWINEVDESRFNELKFSDLNFQVNEQKILNFEEEAWNYFKLRQSKDTRI